MEIIEIEKTAHQPHIIMDPDKGILSFEGNLVVPDSVGFFLPILEWIKDFGESGKNELSLVIKLAYYNTAASKMLLKMFTILRELNGKGVNVNVTWHYNHEDEDMLEVAQETEEISGLNFTYVAV